MHAEISAIRRCRHKQELNGATLIVPVINRFGEFINSKPCPACQEVIKNYGIKEVFSWKTY